MPVITTFLKERLVRNPAENSPHALLMIGGATFFFVLRNFENYLVNGVVVTVLGIPTLHCLSSRDEASRNQFGNGAAK